MKFLIAATVLLAAPALWADTWLYSCGKTMGVENKIRVDRYSEDIYTAQYQYAGRDKTQTIKPMIMKMVGRLAKTDILTGKNQLIFSFQDIDVGRNHLYVQPAIKAETKVKAMRMTVLSQNPQNLSKSPFSCILVAYKN